MRRATALMAQWTAEEKEGAALAFEACKGGFFSDSDAFGLKVMGKTEQDGTPTPFAPLPIGCVKAGTKIRVCGKNFITADSISAMPMEKRGITVTYDRGSFIINGTATADAYFMIANTALPNGTFFLSGTPSVGASTNSYYMYIPRGSGKFWNDRGEGVLIEQTEVRGKAVEIYIKVASGTTVNNIIFHPQIEAGNTKTAFEMPADCCEITVPCDLYEDDVWYPASGIVVRNNAVTTVENLSFAKKNTAPEGFVRYEVNPKDMLTEGAVYCDALETVPYSSMGVTRISISPRNNGIAAIRILADAEYDTVEKMKAAYGSFAVVYALAEAVTETGGNGYHQPISAPRGIVNVSQIPTDSTAELSATMMVKKGV